MFEVLPVLGLDIVSSAPLPLYNERVAPGHRLSPPIASSPNTRILVIANTRAIWEPFVRSLVAHSLTHSEIPTNPLDSFVEHSVYSALGADVDQRNVYFAHDQRQESRFCARTAAEVANIGVVHERSQLLTHADCGPWISVRACVVVDGDVLDAKDFVGVAADGVCRRATGSGRCTMAGVMPNAGLKWRDLVSIRDKLADEVGAGGAWRYADDQIEYHYTWRNEVLAKAVGRARECRSVVLKSLKNSLARVPAGKKVAVLLSGGVDSSALFEAVDGAGERVIGKVVTHAITVSVGEGGTDMEQARRVMKGATGVCHATLFIEIEELLKKVSWVAEALHSFDTMEIRNAVVIAFAMQHAKQQLGCDYVLTGDGADELFGGYGFTHGLAEGEFFAQRKTMLANLRFSSTDLGTALGVVVLQPYLDPEVIQFSSTCSRDEFVGLTAKSLESYNTSLEPYTVGKRILRRAFPECTTVAREKVPIEAGSGSIRLRLGYFDKMTDDNEFAQMSRARHAKHGVVIRDREHLFYFDALLSSGKSIEALIGKVRYGSCCCVDCGFDLGSELQQFCMTCGKWPAREMLS